MYAKAGLLPRLARRSRCNICILAKLIAHCGNNHAVLASRPSAMQAMQVACVTNLLLQCPDGCLRAPQLPLQLLELLPHWISTLVPQGCLRLQGQ